MEHLRGLIRRMVKEAAMLSGPKRIALLRQMSDPDVQRYIAMIDAVQNMKELRATDFNGIVPREKRMDQMLGGIQLYWTLGDFYSAKEAELRRAQKAKERELIDTAKAERTQKKAAVDAKVTSALSNPILMEALTKFGNDFHREIKDGIVQRTRQMIESNFTDGKFNKPRPNLRDLTYAGQLASKSYSMLLSRLVFFMDVKQTSYTPGVEPERTLKPNWEAISDKMANDTASMIVEKWKRKMALKLGEVIDKKGGADIKIAGTIGNERMDFTFADGSSFWMKTQQVYVVNQKGTHFWRFPTTFHNVQFADGTFMQSPSSDRMQAEFGISDATASKD